MDEIASFVRDNPRSNVSEICAALGVKKSLVISMLQSGRLEETNINIKYPCASCGKMIRNGRYCKACGQKITGELAASPSASAKTPPKKEKRKAFIPKTNGWTNEQDQLQPKGAASSRNRSFCLSPITSP